MRVKIAGILATVFCLIVSIVSCAGVENTPEKVAEAFLKSFNAMDFEKAAEFATGEAAVNLALMAELVKSLPADRKTGTGNFALVMGDMVENEGETSVSFTLGQETQTVIMVLEEEKWKVSQVGFGPVKNLVLNTSRAVGEAFLTALKNLEFGLAEQFSSETTSMTLQLIQSMMTPPTDDEKSKAREQTLTITNLQENGDSAQIFYKFGDSEEQMLDLVTVDGQWKADIKKTE